MKNITLSLPIFATALIILSGCSRKVDVASFGASPLADAAVNTQAIARALEGGGKTVTITTPGTYLLEETLLLEDNTTLKCSPGVVLKKARPYSFVLSNAGASTRTTNHDIRIIGATIDADDKYSNDLTIQDAQLGCRGQIDLFHVRDVLIKDVTIYGIVSSEATGIQICSWENIRIKNARIHTCGDALHINRGRRLRVEDSEFCSGDDNIPLNAKDWVSSAPEVGDITDVVFKNVTCIPHENPHGNVARHLVGSWTDWHKGMVVRMGDCVVNAGHTYVAVTGPRFMPGIDDIRGYHPGDAMEYISLTAPDCDADTAWMEDEGGFIWKFEQEDECYHANIENIRYKNVRFTDDRQIIMAYYDTSGVSDRSFHPDTPRENYPFIKNVVFDGVSSNSDLFIGIHSAPNMSFDYRIKNVGRFPEKSRMMRIIGTVAGGTLRIDGKALEDGHKVEVPDNVTVIRE